jgi:hypothetical protein
MNIFVLDNDPVVAAQMQCDKHVVKMVLESAQMLSTISHKLGGISPYRPTHVNHPCVLWAQASQDNWDWLVQHARALADEYTFRYGRVHKSASIINQVVTEGARPTDPGLSPHALCMPEETRIPGNPVDSYRIFYVMDKHPFAAWKKGRDAPDWWQPLFERILT